MTRENRIERLFHQADCPDPPIQLRNDVAAIVENQLRRSTLVADVKLLSLRTGILLVVFAGIWISMNHKTNQIRELTNSNWIRSDGAIDRALYRQIHSIKLSDPMTPADEELKN